MIERFSNAGIKLGASPVFQLLIKWPYNCKTEFIMAHSCPLCPDNSPSIFKDFYRGKKAWKWFAVWLGDPEDAVKVPDYAWWFVICPRCQGYCWRSGELEKKGERSGDESRHALQHPFEISMEQYRGKITEAFFRLTGHHLHENDLFRLRTWVTNSKARAHHPVTWTRGEPVVLSQAPPGSGDDDSDE